MTSAEKIGKKYPRSNGKYSFILSPNGPIVKMPQIV
jgi:hypothetical protein